MIFVFIFLLLFLFCFFLKLRSNNRFVVRLFENSSVCVGGARGTGKDMLFNYVISRRKLSYISNVEYSSSGSSSEASLRDFKRIPFDPLVQWSVGGNTSRSFISGSLVPYSYPFDDGIDYYISDGGIYFPSQEFSFLNSSYPSFPVFQALARHLGDCNIHVNVQSFNRLWDKIREQFETYILCLSCHVLFGRYVFQRVRIYDRYQSAVDHVRPMKRHFGRSSKIEFDKFCASYGDIRSKFLVYRLSKKYDSRRFKSLLGGVL